jgi:hypothetical protein
VTQVEDKALVSYARQVVMEAERAASTEGIISCNTHFLQEYFFSNRSAYKNAYQNIVHMKNLPKINLV